MPGQVGGHYGNTSAVAVFERIGDALVQGEPRRDGEFGVHGFPEQVVGKPGPSAVPIAGKYAGAQALFDEFRDSRGVDAAYRGQDVRKQFVSTNRPGFHERPAARGESGHPPDDQVANGSRQNAVWAARIGQQLAELPGEERMTVGAAMYVDRPTLGRQGPDGVSDQLEHLVR